MSEPEIDDVKRSESAIYAAATTFTYVIFFAVICALILPHVPPGFWLLVPVAVGYLYWEWAGWRQERQFRKELRALDQDGWDR